jgi:Amt family ammonium transporter
MHPAGALVLGLCAGWLFVSLFTLTQNRWKIDDVLGVWPLHGLCGALGGLAAGVLGQEALGGLGHVSAVSQLLGTGLAVLLALAGGFLIYGLLRRLFGLRLDPEQEFTGADLTIHKVSASPEKESGW